MTTICDAAPSDTELELWWLVEAEEVETETAARRLGVELERAPDVVDRVEEFLQAAAKRAAEGREEPRETPWRSSWELHQARIEELLGEAARATLLSLREQTTVCVHEKDDRVEKVVITLKRGRPQKTLLRLLKDLLRTQRERFATAPDALRRRREPMRDEPTDAAPRVLRMERSAGV